MRAISSHIVSRRGGRDTESATLAVFSWLVTKFIVGSPVETLEVNAALYVKQMIDLKGCQEVKSTPWLHQLSTYCDGTIMKTPQILLVNLILLMTSTWQKKKSPGWLYLNTKGILWEHVRNADIVIELDHNFAPNAHLGPPNVMLDTL